MKRSYAYLIAATLLTPAVASAQATGGCIPPVVSETGQTQYAAVEVNGICFDLSDLVTLDRVTGLFRLDVPTLTVGAGLITNLDVTFKTDPFISFGMNTSNLTEGPTSYSFYFATFVTPAFYSSASSSAGVSVTRGQGQSATVAQDGSDPYVRAWGSQGVSLFPLGVDLTGDPCTAGAATTTCSYPAPSGGPETNSFAPTFFDNLEVQVSYTQTDIGSQAGWTGRVDIFEDVQTSVPEPATVVLTLVGLLTLGGVSARRRRTR